MATPSEITRDIVVALIQSGSIARPPIDNESVTSLSESNQCMVTEINKIFNLIYQNIKDLSDKK
ncbi:hypothetical protein [Sporomusa malonica]|uniref:Uncharacterized protein n=1 Tax=Sporomusa malonica TaxID=112901 RepID=A0A1W2AU76_9FIRM|nr:hypothetical protein [Sporomusa malonica]SMC64246.1 hypothetical protein SAMN04488500_106125 [Sporomusa malonica]